MENVKQLTSLIYSCPFNKTTSDCSIRNIRRQYNRRNSEAINSLTPLQISTLCQAHQCCFDKRVNLIIYDKCTRRVPETNPLSNTEKKKLSSQEKNVALLLASGFTVKEISSNLELSELTVSNYRKSIYKKLGVKNVVALVWECVLLDLWRND